ncbi:MAG: GAF domain-containing protein [Planctomycetes bacterium]|nr:GAF domain-containing protein [Planctomycetota bacterium]
MGGADPLSRQDPTPAARESRAPALPPADDDAARTPFERAPVGSLTLDLAGRLLGLDPAAERMLGATVQAGGAVGLPFIELVAPAERPRVAALLARAAAGEAAAFEVTIASGSEGETRRLAGCFIPQRDAAGAVDRLLGMTQDVSERRQVEAFRARQNDILELIAVGAPLPATLDRLARIIESQVAGMLCSVLLLDDDGVHVRHGAAPSLPEAYTRAINGLAIGPCAGSCGTAMFRKTPVTVADLQQDPLWADYRAVAGAFGLRACWSTPILSHQGKVLGSFAMYYREPRSPGPAETRLAEIATHLAGIAIERTQDEEEIRRLNVELEARVQARTRELEAANAELEAFTRTVSHDLRAPLHSIIGYAELLLTDSASRLDEEARSGLRRMSEASRRLQDLIGHLLELSRVSRTDLRRVDTDLSALVLELAADLREAGRDRVVELRVEPGVRAQVDPVLARAALANLLANAWKYTCKKERAEIAFGRTVKDGEPTCFVADNGAGFDVAKATRLFTPFQRFHSDAEFEGSGVGLSTVQRIVERHGGRIWVESAVGSGATFFFTLPDA